MDKGRDVQPNNVCVCVHAVDGPQVSEDNKSHRLGEAGCPTSLLRLVLAFVGPLCVLTLGAFR